MPESKDDILIHYGVKGMKWGRRKRRVPASRARSSSKDSKEYSRLRRRKKTQLSNKQLRVISTRAELEKKYRAVNPTKRDRVKALVASVIALGATAGSLYALSKSPVVKAGVGTIQTLLASVSQIKMEDITDIYDI